MHDVRMSASRRASGLLSQGLGCLSVLPISVAATGNVQRHSGGGIRCARDQGAGTQRAKEMAGAVAEGSMTKGRMNSKISLGTAPPLRPLRARSGIRTGQGGQRLGGISSQAVRISPRELLKVPKSTNSKKRGK